MKMKYFLTLLGITACGFAGMNFQNKATRHSARMELDFGLPAALAQQPWEPVRPIHWVTCMSSEITDTSITACSQNYDGICRG